jgi:hypothetical protein
VPQGRGLMKAVAMYSMRLVYFTVLKEPASFCRIRPVIFKGLLVSEMRLSVVACKMG